jgi:hypothetical protein
MRTEIGTIIECLPGKNKGEYQGYIKLDTPMWDVFFKFNPNSPEKYSKPMFNKDKREPKCGDRVLVTWEWSYRGPRAKFWGYLEDWKRNYRNLTEAVMSIPFFFPSPELESAWSKK